ncbi:hypothetical protein WR25_04638 [Diploscapter pachys]|uniref:long-chain-fatty-acid--CoA ligase n=1 Tax=Diploscapter pachys TaxID=2018661 RepID=A0A2A2KIM8_9BILA|nr:hypothetical protein WR25_04638 [Diploscapter pachys]
MLQRRKSKNIFPWQKPIDYNVQGLPVQGQPGVWKCGYLSESEGNYIEKFYPEVGTLYDLFRRGKLVSASGDCLGSRNKNGQYEYLSFNEVENRAKALSAAFIHEYGLTPGNSTNIGIYSKNCPSWAITVLASVQQSMPIVPLYDTLGPDAACFIVKQAEIRLVVVDSIKRVRSLIEGNNNRSLSLKHIIVIEEDDINEDDTSRAKEVGITLSTFSSALEKGKKLHVKLNSPKPDDTYIICYTSGTTGNPKGVVLTHRNVVANISAWLKMIHTFIPEVEQPLPDETHISYLPLSHMIEQMTHWTMLGNGVRIGYFSGNIQTLADDIQAIRPTIFPTVPRILNRLYDSVQAKLKAADPVSRALFKLAYKRKVAMLRNGVITNTSIWDKLVFSKIQKQMGGRLRQMVTGSAPLSPEVLEFCRVALGCMLVEAYGQTETTSLVCVSWPKDSTGAHVGGPTPCANVKLGDVPELNYFAKDMKGEILVKGPGVTSGYYKDHEKTAELFDEDGFLRTGDIGEMLPNGKMRIIDRKKNIFKLAQGEYVAPEKIESVYVRSHVVQQVFVDGNSFERWLIAVVVPEPDVLCSWAKNHGYGEKTIEDLVEDPKV